MKKLKKINNALLLSMVLVMLLACCMPFFATNIVLAEDENAPRVYYLSDSIPTLSEDELVSMFGAVVTKEIFPDYDSEQFNEFLNSSFNLIAQNNDIVIIEIKRIVPDIRLIKDLCDFFTGMGCKVILLSTYDLSYFQYIHEGYNIDKYIKCPTVGLYDYVANSLRDMITNHNFGNGSIILIDSRLVPFSYFDYQGDDGPEYNIVRACERVEFLQILFKELHYQLGITSCAYDNYIGMEAELESREIQLLVHNSALTFFFDILNMHEHTFPLQDNDSYDDYNFHEGTADRQDLINKLQNNQVFAMGQWELSLLYYDFLVGLQSINQQMPIYVRVVDAFGENPDGLLVTTDADLMTTYGLSNRYLYNPKAQLENSLEEMISSL